MVRALQFPHQQTPSNNLLPLRGQQIFFIPRTEFGRWYRHKWTLWADSGHSAGYTIYHHSICLAITIISIGPFINYVTFGLGARVRYRAARQQQPKHGNDPIGGPRSRQGP